MSTDSLNGEYFSRLNHPILKAFNLLLKLVWRNKILDSLTDRFFCRVAKDLRECRVDTHNPAVAISQDNSLWNPREQFAESCPLLLEFVAQAGQRLQVNYTLDLNGQILDVWILTPQERDRKPWPENIEQARKWVFNADAQAWSKP